MTFVTRLCIIVAMVMSVSCTQAPQSRPGFETVQIAGTTYELELALDDASRSQGMMGRTEFPESGGMLFVFPDSQIRQFWMKNCLIDMDLIFLDGLGYIVALHEMTVEPPRRPEESEFDYETRLIGYRSGTPAQFAIELESGSIRKLKLKVEDRIELDLQSLKARAR